MTPVTVPELASKEYKEGNQGSELSTILLAIVRAAV